MVLEIINNSMPDEIDKPKTEIDDLLREKSRAEKLEAKLKQREIEHAGLEKKYQDTESRKSELEKIVAGLGQIPSKIPGKTLLDELSEFTGL